MSTYGEPKDSDIVDTVVASPGLANPTAYVDTENPCTIEKIVSLAKTLSNKQKVDASVFNDPDIAVLLQQYIGKASSQGIILRQTGMTFRQVETIVSGSSYAYASSMSDIIRVPQTLYRCLRAPVIENKIIKNVNGCVKAGEMCLVIGKPGAGCTTFLKTLAGKHEQFLKVNGDVRFDGIPSSEMFSKYKGDFIYNGEHDVHFPQLTVDQTLQFAIACKVPRTRLEGVSEEQYIKQQRDFLAHIFNLGHTLHTNVGDDFTRGVSGGERKRVSIAEAIAARGSVYMWDNATRGLDSAMATSFVKSIRTMTNLLGSIAFVTLYQASDTIYNMFDKVTVLYEGRQIYFGPVERAKAYFEDMGYVCLPRQETTEFLTSITDISGRVVRKDWERRVPRTAKEFEERWLKSPEYAKLNKEILSQIQEASPSTTKEIYEHSFKQEKGRYTRARSCYQTSFPTQIRLCAKRALQRIRGDSTYTITNIVAGIVQALISGSLYYKTSNSTDGVFSRTSVVQYMLLYYALMGLTQLPNMFANRPILVKQKSYILFHPSAETLATAFVEFPFRLIGFTCFYIIIYFLSNMRMEAGRFFLTYLFLILGSETITLLFQTVAAACDTISQADAFCGILLMAMCMYSTYMIQYPDMHGWAKYWIPYLNPLRWCLESMLMSEFHGRKMECGNYVPNGPGYENATAGNRACAFIGSEPGNPLVSADKYMALQFGFAWKHVWRNFGILFAFFVVLMFLYAYSTEIKKPSKESGDRLSFKRGSVKLSSGAKDIEMGSVDEFPVSEATAVDQGFTFQHMKGDNVFIWKNINYEIPYENGTRKLLDDIQGYVKPGTLTALMGASGAGKTTLLNTLSKRIDFGVVTGDLLINGHSVDASFKRSTGYVQQQDIHITELTVRESLQFAARMRRPNTVPDTEKMEYVEKIIEVLDMSMYADAIVGETGFGLNVEQRKKLSIGVELVTKPSLLLFLDEPTSGLDSESARSIVQLLRKLADAGQAIMCTIHQPSSTLFNYFEKLLLLQKGGQTVYFGDIGENSNTMLQYFERNGARKCGENENPAEYILEIIGASGDKVEQDWNQIWKTSREHTILCKEVDYLIQDLSSKPSTHSQAELTGRFAVSYWHQFKYLYLRTSTQFWRDPEYISSKFALMAVAGLFNGFTFYRVTKTTVGMQNCMFSVLISMVISAPLLNQIQARAVASRELFEAREFKSNTFHWAILLFVQYLNELPYHLVFSTIFFCCYYFPLKVDNSPYSAGLFYFNYCIMFQLYYIGFGLAVLYMSPNLATAAILNDLFLSFMLSFNGVIQPAILMPVFWRYTMYLLSPYTYFMQNFLGLILNKREVVCSKQELSFFDPPLGQTCGEYMSKFFETNAGYVTNPNATFSCSFCPLRVGDEYLAMLNINHSEHWRNIGVFCIYIVFNIFAMFAIYYAFSVRRVSLKDLKLLKRMFK